MVALALFKQGLGAVRALEQWVSCCACNRAPDDQSMSVAWSGSLGVPALNFVWTLSAWPFDLPVLPQGWSLQLVPGDPQAAPQALPLPPGPDLPAAGGSTILTDQVSCPVGVREPLGQLHAALQALSAINGSTTGGTLVLKRPDGSVASSLGPGLPR